MVVLTSKNFEKAVKKLPKKIKYALKKRLCIFISNPFDPILNNHHLQGSLRHYRSINITSDHRLIYEEYRKDVIRLIDIDTHSNLYSK